MLELQQQQKLKQKLSPQQIQYIKLLQLPTLALEQRIKDELEENPLLEEGEDPNDPIEERLEELRAEDDELDNEDDYDWEELLNSADDLYGYKARVDSGGEDDHEVPMPAQASITEELRDQFSMLNLDADEHLIAEQIIGSLDPDGYLRRPLESIVDDIMFNEGLTLDEDDVENILGQIQQLDPIGIASRDLQECLLVQLRTLPEDVPHRDTAIRMLDHHYKAFTMKHFGKLGKRLDLDDAELKATFELIQSLNPKPGEGEFTAQENYITPDFTLRYVDGEFVISLNGRNAPEMHISPHYRSMLEKLSAEKKNKEASSDVDDETRDFLKNKFESARWFINSINQRRQTMLKVMHAIVDLQAAFFKYGEGNLKPMILEDIADIIEMDISTVSRVVNGKYVQTDFGVYELKYFFSEGLETKSGEEVSNKEVKVIIRRIVAKEDKANPLSDQKVADRLAERGFKIARRTVTKYRKQLDIPVARLRKEIVLDKDE